MADELDFTQPPPQTQTLSEAQALIERLWELMGRAKAVEARVAELEERLGVSSRNASQPPSQDGPQVPPQKRPPTGRSRGGQPGHRGQRREALPPEAVCEGIACRVQATQCACGHRLPQPETPSRRHQVIDLPTIEPQVSEYQLFDIRCPCCGPYHEAPLPVGVPSGMLGPRLLAEIGVLSGRFHLSVRKLREWLWERYGVKLSVGTVSAAQGQLARALAAPVAELAQAVRPAPAQSVDETSRKHAGERCWLWTVTTALWAFFAARLTRGPVEVRTLLGEVVQGIIVTARYRGYHGLPLAQRQICWAHLLRDFRRIEERGGYGGRIGRRLRAYGQVLFRWHHRYRRGALDAAAYRRRMPWLRRRVRAQLEHGAGSGIFSGKTAGTCKQSLSVELALWTFVEHSQVEPTNHAAERALRPFVIWRKLSFQTQSARGEQFVARLLTAVETCRRQQRPVSGYLLEAVTAYLAGTTPPSLIPQPAST